MSYRSMVYHLENTAQNTHLQRYWKEIPPTLFWKFGWHKTNWSIIRTKIFMKYAEYLCIYGTIFAYLLSLSHVVWCVSADDWLFIAYFLHGEKSECILAYIPKLTISQRRTPKDHLWEKMQCWIFESIAKWKKQKKTAVNNGIFRILARAWLDPWVSDLPDTPQCRAVNRISATCVVEL